MNPEYQYMADFTLPDDISEEFMALIPFQRAVVDRFLEEGKLMNYALSMEEAKLWVIFKANSELDVLNMIADFPLAKFMEVKISILNIYNATNPNMPNFSLN
ncbi:MAG: muconolactone Delta-isomerase family protein [Saprospiraceae bacterium]